ncbi:O-antigen ligase family protein [Methylobacterium trifolii]|uniref:O-antigen ligase-related domain-containing protein n=1 Tax=Methylobacterium trifolii TaxID=1003092 RepID=A0ABQ4TU08_9HYPH|nr:O-antigen ligase [Methylobacterium trifolii]GJE58404.1 hypothetical protein MPOCJGCO_0485 [Methylobacterium trifolii]
MSATAGIVSGHASAPAARDMPDALRVGLMAVVLVALWNRAWFTDLADRDLLSVAEGGNLWTQVLFLALGGVMGLAVLRLGAERLRPLASPPLLLFTGWLAVSTVLSTDLSLSVRRIALYAIVAFLAAGLLVVARSARQFASALAIAAGIILAACYLGIAFAPRLTIHSAYDVTNEYNHIGLWRGVFPHKNEAGAAMAMLVVCGLYVAAVRDRFLGWVIVAASLVFLASTASKTALAVLPVVFLVTNLCGYFRGGAMRGLMLLGPVAVMAVATIGATLLPPVRAVLDLVLPDASFTARNEIWSFAIENIMQHPVKGWGYGAFWLTDRTIYGSGSESDWVQTATQAHNAYLDAALVMGLPGLLLTVVALMVAPVRDLQRAAGGKALDPPTLLFLRLWLLAILTASFENSLFNANSTTCGMALLAIFGLRMRAVRRPVIA